MAGWLGTSFASRLDNIKSQVSSMAKEVFVEDEETDGSKTVENGEQLGVEGHIEEADLLKELHRRCRQLEKLNQDAVKEKEEQCKNFRQLLLEKEEEIMELQQLLDTDPEEGDETHTENESSKVRERNRKLQSECNRLKESLHQSLQTQQDHERHNTTQADQFEQLAVRLADAQVRLDQSEETVRQLRLDLDASRDDAARMAQKHEAETKDLRKCVRDRDLKLEEISQIHLNEIKVKESDWREERRKMVEEIEHLKQEQTLSEQQHRDMLDSLKQEHRERESEIVEERDSFQQRVTDMQMKTDQLKTENEKKEERSDQNFANSSSLQCLQQQIQTLQDQLEQQQQQYKQQLLHQQQLEQQQSDKTTAFDEMRQSLNDTECKSKEQQQQLSQQCTQIETLSTELEAARAELEKLTEENENLLARLASAQQLEKENARLEQELVLVQNKLDELERSCSMSDSSNTSTDNTTHLTISTSDSGCAASSNGSAIGIHSTKSATVTEDVDHSHSSHLYDVTSIVEENRELKEKLRQIGLDAARRRHGERKLEELSILLKMKNVDLEHQFCALQQENHHLSLENSSLKSRSETSSLNSFPSFQDFEEYTRDLDSKSRESLDRGGRESSERIGGGGRESVPKSNNAKSPEQPNGGIVNDVVSRVYQLEQQVKERDTAMQVCQDKLKHVEHELVETKTQLLSEQSSLLTAVTELQVKKGEIADMETNKIAIASRQKAELCAKEAELSSKEAELRDKECKVIDLQQIVVELRQDKCRLDETIADLSSKLVVFDVVQTQLEESERRIVELSNEVAARQKTTRDTEEEQLATSAQAQQEILCLQERLLQVERQLETKCSDMDRVEQDAAQLRATLTDIQYDKEMMTSTVRAREVDLAKAEASVSQLEEEIRVASQKLEDIQATLSVERDFAEQQEQALANVKQESSLREQLLTNQLEELQEEWKNKEQLLTAELDENIEERTKSEQLMRDKIDFITQELAAKKEFLASKLEQDEHELTRKLEEAENTWKTQQQTLQKQLDEERLIWTGKEQLMIEEHRTSLQDVITARETLQLDLTQVNQRLTQQQAKTEELIQQLADSNHQLQDYKHRIEEKEQSDETGDGESHLVQVLNEKTRELTQARSENAHLLHRLEAEKSQREEQEVAQNELRQSYSEMKNETVSRLSNLVRDKELEVTSLHEKNNSLLQVLHTDRDRCTHLEKENESLVSQVAELQEKVRRSEDDSPNPKSVDSVSVQDNTVISSVSHTKEHEMQAEENVSQLHQQITALSEQLTSAEAVASKARITLEENSARLTVASAEHAAESARLKRDLATLAGERDQVVERLTSRENEVRELHREVKSVIDKKKWVDSELDRLRGHLVEVEESYTQELMQSEQREQDLQLRVGQLEGQVKQASLSQSEASQEASEATSHLTEALTAAAASRDSTAEQLRTSQAKLREKSSALRNLQLALEGFQKQKENELRQAERRCLAKIEAEQRSGDQLRDQLAAANAQLERAGEGLEAAARLSQQLDAKQQVITGLKHEITTREELLQAAQTKLDRASTAQVGRVDRELVKNLVLGYVTADPAKRGEVLRVIATVLDFNKEDRSRSGLDGAAASNSWLLGGLLRGNRELGVQQRGPNTDQMNQSIAQAFVKFLEEESVPQTPVVLPVLEMAKSKQEQMASSSLTSTPTSSASGMTTVRSSPLLNPLSSGSPLLLNPLPSFTTSTSNILKTVLDDDSDKK